MKYRCTICGHIYHNTIFKGGYVCEDCVNYIKSLDLTPAKPAERRSGSDFSEKARVPQDTF